MAPAQAVQPMLQPDFTLPRSARFNSIYLATRFWYLHETPVSLGYRYG